MNSLHQGWFSEIQDDLWPGQCFSLKVKNILHEEKSKFQDIQILETTNYGRALILDGIVQCTTRDEFAYQEMISFLPLSCHSDPKTVLIVGGGDGGVAREVVKHPNVESVQQVEIDERVIELSKEFLPEMACGYDSPKVQLTIADGLEFLRDNQNRFDVIITDCSDPVGPNVSLFDDNYFRLAQKALRPNGIVCLQSGIYWLAYDFNTIKKTLKSFRQLFPVSGYALASVPTYTCGQIGFVLGSLDKRTKLNEPSRLYTNKEIDEMNLRYYSSEIHKAAFTLPRYVEKAFYEID